MGKSFKKNPHCKFGHSDKYDRRRGNRNFRHAKPRVIIDIEGEADTIYPILKEISNNWSWASDGKGIHVNIKVNKYSRRDRKFVTTTDRKFVAK